jgi:hypothetical protein
VDIQASPAYFLDGPLLKTNYKVAMSLTQLSQLTVPEVKPDFIDYPFILAGERTLTRVSEYDDFQTCFTTTQVRE